MFSCILFIITAGENCCCKAENAAARRWTKELKSAIHHMFQRERTLHLDISVTRLEQSSVFLFLFLTTEPIIREHLPVNNSMWLGTLCVLLDGLGSVLDVFISVWLLSGKATVWAALVSALCKQWEWGFWGGKLEQVVCVWARERAHLSCYVLK